MRTVTLDTNVVQEYWHQREKVAVVDELLGLAEEGHIDLAVTRRIHDDIPCPPLADRINELSKIGVRMTGSVFRIGQSVLNGPDMLGSETAMDAFDSVINNLALQGQSAPDWRDWDHLHGHYLLKRDVFLTWDKGILRVASKMKEQLSMAIMKPENFIHSIK